jgi:hypothetical protein
VAFALAIGVLLVVFAFLAASRHEILALLVVLLGFLALMVYVLR